MILVCKRFELDDIPLTIMMNTSMEQAVNFWTKKAESLTRRAKHATREDQEIAWNDVSSDLIAYLLVEFTENGTRLKSCVVSV